MMVPAKVLGQGRQTHIQIGIDPGKEELLRKGSEEINLPSSGWVVSLRNGTILRALCQSLQLAGWPFHNVRR